MAAKSKTTKSEETGSDPLIKTVSEVEAMTDKEKEEFRASGGTTIQDPE